MRRGYLAWGVLILGLVLGGAAGAAEPGEGASPDEVADAYIGSILRFDWDAMVTFLDGDSLYEDPTMDFFDRPSVELRGAEAIVGFWRQSGEDAGTREIRFEVSERFAVGEHVVLKGRAVVRVAGTTWGIDQPEVELSFDQITHLQIRDGKVLRHRDLLDYAELMEQVEARKAERRSRVNPPPT